MKSDLDALMQAKDLNAILILGDAFHNPPMYYFVGAQHVSGATLVKKRGEQPVLICNDMERDEAAKSGLKAKSYSDYNLQETLKRAGGDAALMHAMLFQAIFADLGITRGRVGVYGQSDVGSAFAAFARLQELIPEIALVGEAFEDSILLKTMETKDEAEVARIRKMGRITTEVVGRVADYLTSRDVRADEVLLKEDSSPLTIADVKSKINLWLAERSVENPEGTIFAIGRDAGVPHSVGNPQDPIVLGKAIIFDIFPCEAGGGYFYDFTRTWSLGYATPEAQKLYDEVKAVYEKVIKSLDLNTVFKDYQRLVCDEFNKNGHKTPIHSDGPQLEGYVHSLGHGVGLNVHERPWSRHTSSDDNILKPGVVITIEPGLYYPEKGVGVRIEDTLWVRPDGKFEILAEYPYDFVLPMKKWKKK